MMLIDSHCHLDFFNKEEIAIILKTAKQAQVSLLQTICTKASEFDKILDIVTSYENVYGSVGIHPCEILKEDIITVDTLTNLTKHDKIISIGETGLDYYHHNNPSKESQAKSFKIHIEVARTTGLPLIIHSRSADEDMIRILQNEYSKGKFKAVMHSFASSQELHDAALALGFYISYSGIITFKNAIKIQEIACKTPKNRLLVETDSPYLAPVPNRGKRNEPSFLPYIAAKLNELKKCNNIHNITTDNFFNLFNKRKGKTI